MKTKHTPGPWIAVINNPLSTVPGHSIKSGEGSHLPVAIVHAHQGSKGPGEGIANAHLVKAAPLMLAALQATRPFIAGRKLIAQVDAAIAAANA